MIIGTAGHVDHGKSALVEALTHRRMDRLAEERRRGITIDLNFAALDLGEGNVAGVVDVPGHEDLVRTMVAGATGIDVVLLVVAADEGVMPQTREHLAIAETLGVPVGIPVITKADLVEPAWLDLVREDLADQLAHSAIRFGEPIVAATPTGRGVSEVRDRILALVGQGRPRSADDLFRLPVDRSFSRAGVGTVVTGSCWTGRVAVGDEVRLLPGDHAARIRSIERHGVALDTAGAGDRVALGLAGVDRGAAGRGTTVVSQGGWVASLVIDAVVRLLPDAPRPLAHRTRLRVLLGTAEVMARVHTTSPVAPGRRAIIRLLCERELVARGGDRLVLRSYSPVTTIGGGEVLDPSPPRRGGTLPPAAAEQEAGRRLAILLERRGDGVAPERLAVLTGLPPAAAERAATECAEAILIAGRWTTAASLREAVARAQDGIARHHREHPGDFGAPLETIRSIASPRPWLGEAALEALVGRGGAVSRGGIVYLPGFEPRIQGGGAAVDRVVRRVADAGLRPPTVAELAAELTDIDVPAALRLAAADRRVVAVERDRYYGPAAIATWVGALQDVAAEGEIGVAALRNRLGLSRRFLIPLLEWADREGHTVRTGDTRRLGRRNRSPAT